MRSVIEAPHPVAIASALAFGLFWARAGAPVRAGRPGAWFGLVLGAVVYPFVQVWLHGDATRVVVDLLATNLRAVQGLEVDTIMVIVVSVMASYADEITKLAMLVFVMLVMGQPSDARAITAAAVAPTAGYAMVAAQVALSRALGPVGSEHMLAYSFVHEWAWLGLQFGIAYLLARGWMADRLVGYFMAAGILHALALYVGTLQGIGWHPAVVTLLVVAISLFAFSWGASVIPSGRR